MRRGAVAAALALVCVACEGATADSSTIAALRLTCTPAAVNVRYQVVALFRNVRHPPDDVTAVANWRLSGVKGARMRPDGLLVTPPGVDGIVTVEVVYASQRTRLAVQVFHAGAGQVLGTLRGRVYTETEGILEPAAFARIEVVEGADLGASAVTDRDGRYELDALVPGAIVVRATRLGYTAAERSLPILAGENRLSLVITRAGRSGGTSARVRAHTSNERRNQSLEVKT